MYRIESKISVKSADFKENKEHMCTLVREFKERLQETKKGGPARAHEKHKARGKLTVRERLKRLFDPNTPFLEFNTLAAYDMYDNQAPAA